MRLWRHLVLFWRLFGSAKNLDVGQIQRMGLFAVKVAQMYAVRADLLGVEKCRQLQKLFEEAIPIPWREAEVILEREASSEFWEAVADIDPDGATLKSGEEVIVKFVREESGESFLADLNAMRWLMRFALFFYPKLERLADPLGTLDTIERLTLTELNLLNEVRGTKRLEELCAQALQGELSHFEKLSFPRIYQDLSSEKVLVVERLHQKSVREGLDSEEFHYQDLLLLFRLHGYYLFYRGEFHGDLHPGNVFFGDAGIWMIDNANVEVVESDFTRGLLSFLQELGAGDFQQAAHLLCDLSLEPPEDREVFVKAFQNLYQGFAGKTVGEASLTNQMMETVKLAVKSGMEFPSGAFPVIKSLMYLDGMALRCGRDKKLLEDVVAFGDELPK